MFSATTRRRVVNGLLVLVTLWPPVHILLVQRFDLSSWKLAGWGMYATPRPDVFGMEIYGGPAGESPLEQLAAPSQELRREATAFLERFRWLRGLTPTGSLERAVRAEHPSWTRMRVVVHQTDLDRASGMLVTREVAIERAGASSVPSPGTGR